VNYEKDQILCNQGDKIEHMYIIVSGLVSITCTMDNFPVVIEYLTAGSSLHGEAFLQGDKMDVVAKCESKVTVYALKVDAFYLLS